MVAAAEQVSPPLEVEDIAIEELHFDSRNPRLFLESDLSDEELIQILWREFVVDEVALSIANNGYFRHEPLFVARENGRLIVVEGNRRLAAVRLLRDKALRTKIKATDLPDISDELHKNLEQLPVVISEREKVWQYVGFKHINGPQPWQSYAKAQYIAWLHNDLKVPLDEIASSIGDRHWTVRRLYRGLMVLRQAQRTGEFELEDRWKKHFSFSHLYTGLNNPILQDFLGINDQNSYQPNPVPSEYISNLGELCLWLFGRESTDTRPVVRTQNPDLRNLISAIGSSDGLSALRRGLSLNVALDISRGDETLFKEYLLQARYLLQQARGKQLTGDSGDSGTLQTAKEILDLADQLVLDMEQHRREGRSTRRSRYVAS